MTAFGKNGMQTQLLFNNEIIIPLRETTSSRFSIPLHLRSVLPGRLVGLVMSASSALRGDAGHKTIWNLALPSAFLEASLSRDEGLMHGIRCVSIAHRYRSDGSQVGGNASSGGEDWQYEPKWDGFRCLAFKAGAAVDIRAKSGKPLGRYFPELIELLRNLSASRFVVDGEIVIEISGRYSFEALQMRLHPAESRIRKLAAETPAKLILFDILADATGMDLREKPLSLRRTALEKFATSLKTKDVELSPFTLDVGEAEKWLASRDIEKTDGIVAKRRDGQYVSGERAMVKVKYLRSADCVVGGFRYLAGKKDVGSLLLGLYDAEGKLHHVGFTSTIRNEDRAALTKQLEKLRQAPGFTGNAPGGPSRWSTERSAAWEPLRPTLVVEVRFDQVTGRRFRHGTKLLRWRPDKAPGQCTFEQIA